MLGLSLVPAFAETDQDGYLLRRQPSLAELAAGDGRDTHTCQWRRRVAGHATTGGGGSEEEVEVIGDEARE